jgi:hypothetical protein
VTGYGLIDQESITGRDRDSILQDIIFIPATGQSRLLFNGSQVFSSDGKFILDVKLMTHFQSLESVQL